MESGSKTQRCWVEAGIHRKNEFEPRVRGKWERRSIRYRSLHKKRLNQWIRPRGEGSG